MATSKKRTPKKRTKASADWSDAFLASLRQSANVRLSCEKAGIARSVAYARRDNDTDFAAAWAAALHDAVDRLEQVAWQRAQKSSDTLLIFLLKAHRPDLYRDKLEVTQRGTLEIIEEIIDAPSAQDHPPALGAATVPPQ